VFEEPVPAAEDALFQPRWSIRDGLMAIAAVLAVMFSLGRAAAQLTAPSSGLLFQINFLAALVQTVLLAGLPVLIAVRRYGHTLSDLGFIPGGLRRGWQQGARWGIGLFFLVVLAGILLALFNPSLPEPQDFAKLVMMVDSPYQLLLVVLMGVVLAPLGEELFFRGFFYPALRQSFGIGWGILLTAFFFAALHFDVYRLLPIAAGGAGLTYLFQKTGNIWTNIIAHAVWNGIMIGLIVITNQAGA